MKIKAIIEHEYTKRCVYGNVYHTVKITHPATGRSVTTKTPSLGNVTGILYDAFGGHKDMITTESCTGSARISSLPDTGEMLPPCRYKAEWKKALNAIGYRNLAAAKA